ncbi:MAG: hypothetical protein ACXWW6_02380, partial [Candidatus Limnocylindrales bacterium]
RALAPDLEVVDVSDDPAFDFNDLTDPDLEVIVGRRAPTDLARVPALRWLQVGSAGVDHLAADPPWAKGILVTNGRGVFSVQIGEYVSGAILRINQPLERWAADQASRHWPVDDEPLLPPESPLRNAPNVTITPHVSGATNRFRDELVLENVRRYLAGEPLLNPVDPERGH